MTRNQCVFSSTGAQPQAALSLPPSLRKHSVPQKSHIREREFLNRKSLVKESNDALTMRKCFAAIYHMPVVRWQIYDVIKTRKCHPCLYYISVTIRASLNSTTPFQNLSTLENAYENISLRWPVSVVDISKRFVATDGSTVDRSMMKQSILIGSQKSEIS